MNENTVLISEVPGIWYEIKKDGRRRYHFNQAEILNYLKINNIKFSELAKLCKMDRQSYDNIRQALARVGGITDKAHKQNQIGVTFSKSENGLYHKFTKLCYSDRKKPSRVLKILMKEYIEKTTTKTTE